MPGKCARPLVLLVALIGAALLVTPVLARQTEPRPDGAGDVARRVKLAEGVAKSFVRVEITPRFDNGQAPNRELTAASRRINSPELRASGRPTQNWERVIEEERPLFQGGFLVGPTRVYTGDHLLHPRFVKSIQVRFGEGVVDAKVASYPLERGGVFLELSAPLVGAETLKFDPAAPAPHAMVEFDDDATALEVGSFPGDIAVGVDGQKFFRVGNEALVVGTNGAAVGITGTSRLAVGDAWKGDPSSWPALSGEQFAAKVAEIAKSSSETVLRVALTFRSPRNQGDAQRRGYDNDRDENESATEWNGTGLLTDENTVLVLAKFKPKVTARLERVRVFDSAGREHAATFAGTLRDWGAFLAKLESPIPGGVRLASEPLTGLRNRLLMRAEVAVRGESRTSHVWQQRIYGYYIGRHGTLYPDLPATDHDDHDYEPSTARSFAFGLDGVLVALPIQHREKITVGREDDLPLVIPAAVLLGELGRGAAAIEPENRPLAEDEENRLAWLGVELQGLDSDLARANNVSEQTEDGSTGAIITFIYENSPAAAAGLRSGDILLRLHVAGQPKPLEISGEFDSSRNMQNFWQYLDQIPPEYFERIPTPWPASETALARSLTDLGFGTPFSAEIFRDGKVSSVDLKVAQGPAHYDAAKRYTSEDLGITVRDITYEVRRYFRLKPGDPGVIVSKVDKGGKAAIAGVKPYELVTSINDQPITSVADAEKGVKAGGELRIGIKRMTQGRMVKVKAGPSAEAQEAPKAEGVENPSKGDLAPAEQK